MTNVLRHKPKLRHGDGADEWKLQKSLSEDVNQWDRMNGLIALEKAATKKDSSIA